MADIITFTEIIEQPIIGLQITFEHNTETKQTIPVGLMMYSYPSKCFMCMTHKMHGVFFRTIIENTLASIDIEQKVRLKLEPSHISNHLQSF